MIFNIKEPENYSKRNKKSIVLNVILTAVIIIIAATSSNWQYVIAIGIFVFCIQFFKSSRWDKFFITTLEIKDSTIEIIYKERDSCKKLKGNIEDFTLKKETLFSKVRTAYLAVYYKGQLIVKQFEIGEWKENKFDEVLELFNKEKK